MINKWRCEVLIKFHTLSWQETASTCTKFNEGEINYSSCGPAAKYIRVYGHQHLLLFADLALGSYGAKNERKIASRYAYLSNMYLAQPLSEGLKQKVERRRSGFLKWSRTFFYRIQVAFEGY